MAHITVTKRRFCLTLCTAVFFIIILPHHNAYPASAVQVAPPVLDREYIAFLLGTVFFLPEVIDLTLLSDNTFSIRSDLFIQPATGTYHQENFFLLHAQGTTGKFFDPDFQEDIEIQYDFRVRPMGFRNRLVAGSGTRTFIFTKDGTPPTPERFIYCGSGF
jgi:hypothetical protein